jgi:predicted transcriptional regulator
MLLTVSGQVQAVLVDPRTYQAMEARIERDRFIAAIRDGEKDIEEGRHRPAAVVFADLKAKHGF